MSTCGVRRSYCIMDHVEQESVLEGTTLIWRSAQRLLEEVSKRCYHGSAAASLTLTRFLNASKSRPVEYLPYGAEPIRRDLLEANSPISKRWALTKYALFAGGFYKNYGIWDLLSAAALMQAAVPDFQLCLLGRGPEEHLMRQWIYDRNLTSKIIICGYVQDSELTQLLCGANALIAPLNDTRADWARCPSKIPLYMMSDRPIVTCRIGEAWEYLGDAGFYYSPGNVGSLVQVLTSLWKLPPFHPNYANESYTWQRLTERYLRFWTPIWRDYNIPYV